jgi:glycosyltransferase involved in cell wall biosynthesis
MYVVQFAPYYPPYLGGQETYIAQLSRELVRSGHRVRVVTSNYPKGAAYEKSVDGVEICRFACFGRPLRNPILPGLLISHHAIGADLIHAHNIHSFSSNVAALRRRFGKTPLVMTSHGRLDFGARLPNQLLKLYIHTVGRFTVKSADRLIVLTPTEKTRILQQTGMNAEKISVIPVGIDLEHWDCLREEARKKWEAALFPGKIMILVATQLILRKGIQYLIGAMPKVIKQFPNVLLAIAGNGSDEGRLRRQVVELGLEDTVFFLGRLSGMDLARAYDSASLFVLPSLGEGQPPCILESWSFSKPVLATNIEGVRDYFSEAARLVEPASSSALASGILEILGDQVLARRMGNQGRQLVERFTLQRMTRLVINDYYRALGASSLGGSADSFTPSG